MTSNYRFIEHTSDIIIEAKGETFASAFESLAQGMFTQMGDAKPKEKMKIEATGTAPDILLVNALSTLLAEMEIEKFTPAKIADVDADLEKGKISFSVLGEKKQPKNIIKAVTFHELQVEEKAGKWRLRVLFDI